MVWHGLCSNTHASVAFCEATITEARTTSPVFALLVRRAAPSPARGAHLFYPGSNSVAATLKLGC
jgi:hypothetical protein